MIGYILMGLGAYLVADDFIKGRRAKREKLLENGNGGSGGDNLSKSRTSNQESNRDGRIKPFPVETKGGTNELHKKPIHEIGTDKAGSSAGDNSSGQPDATTSDNQAESVKAKNKGGSNGSEINSENVISDNGGDVDVKPISVDESDSSKAD